MCQTPCQLLSGLTSHFTVCTRWPQKDKGQERLSQGAICLGPQEKASQKIECSGLIWRMTKVFSVSVKLALSVENYVCVHQKTRKFVWRFYTESQIKTWRITIRFSGLTGAKKRLVLWTVKCLFGIRGVPFVSSDRHRVFRMSWSFPALSSP